jgi:hypothetical protein
MAVKDDTPITRGLFSGFEMGGGGYAPGQFFPSQVDYGTKPSDITAGMEVQGFGELDKADLHQRIISGDIKLLGGNIVRYEGIDVPLSFIYGPLPEGAAYYEVGDLDGDGENEVFTARTEQGGGETVIDVRSVISGDSGAEVQTVSYDDFVVKQTASTQVGISDNNPWVDVIFDGNAADSFRDLFRELITHVEKQPGEDRKPFITTINQFRVLVGKFLEGEATLRDLRDFDAGVLSGTTQWEDVYNSVLGEVGQAPQTWDEVEEILRRNGYSENEIEDVRNSVRCLIPTYSIENGQNVLDGYKIACSDSEQFQGSSVLAGILGDLGYEGGDWWDIRPSKQDGDNCLTTDESGNTAVGTVVNGKCVVEGDDDGDGTEDADCTTITQENADACGYEITSDGQLIPKDLSGDPNDYPNYTSCGGNIFVIEGNDCPDLEGTGGTDGDPCTIDGKEGTIQNGVCVPNETLQDLVDEFGEAAVETAQKVYDYVKDKFEEVIDDPLGVLRDIITSGVIIGDERCWEPGEQKSCDTADPEKGDICWKDCVNLIGVLAIPGLPMPPGIGELATVRDLEDFLKGIGKTLGEFIEDPIGTVEGWIGDLIEKIKGLFDVDENDASKIIDWLKGIFGAAVGAWVWNQVEEGVTDVFTNLTPYGLCEDGETPKSDPDGRDCPTADINCADFGKTGGLVYKEEQCGEALKDCADEGKQGGLVENPETDCGPCLDTHVLEDGKCVEWVDDGPTEQECAEQNKEHIPSPAPGTKSACGGCIDTDTYQLDEDGNCEPSPITCDPPQVLDSTGTQCIDPVDCVKGNACETEDNKTGVYGDDCECIPDFVNTGPSVQDCDNLGKFHIAADPANNEPSKCGECKQTGYSAESEDAPCTQDIRICEDGQEADPNKGCPEDYCDDAMTVPKNEDGSCPDISTVPCTEPNKIRDNDGNCVCDEGFVPSRFEGGGCIPDPDCPNGTPKANYVDGNCDGDCREGYVKKDGSCVPECKFKAGIPATDDDCKQDPEIDCTDPNLSDNEKIGICNWVSCPGAPSVLYPPGTDLDKVCGEEPGVCTNESGEPSGAVNYPDCDLCPRGQRFNDDGICVPDEGPPPDPCDDPQTDEDYRTCNYFQCPNDDTWHPPESDPEKVCAEVVPPECLDPQTDQDYRDCGYLQCGPNTPNEGQWFPKDTDMKEACGPVIIVDDFCDDPNSTTYGQVGECGPCKDTFEKQGDKCGCPEGTTQQGDRCVPIITGECQDPDANNTGEPGECTYDDPCDSYDYASKNPIECNWFECPDGGFAPTEADCEDTPDPCDSYDYASQNPLECGWVECPNGGFAPTQDQCEVVVQVCDDPTATNYGEQGPCTYGPDCNDCTCAEYAEEHPEECGPEPPPPPQPPGGGLGGEVETGMFGVEPMTISGDPQLLARLEFPIVDYLSEAINKDAKNNLMQGMLTGNIV